jgi:hypothetical protein
LSLIRLSLSLSLSFYSKKKGRKKRKNDNLLLLGFFRLRPEEPQSLWNLILALTNHAIVDYGEMKQKLLKKQWKAIERSQKPSTSEKECDKDTDSDNEDGRQITLITL